MSQNSIITNHCGATEMPRPTNSVLQMVQTPINSTKLKRFLSVYENDDAKTAFLLLINHIAIFKLVKVIADSFIFLYSTRYYMINQVADAGLVSRLLPHTSLLSAQLVNNTSLPSGAVVLSLSLSSSLVTAAQLLQY